MPKPKRDIDPKLQPKKEEQHIILESASPLMPLNNWTTQQWICLVRRLLKVKPRTWRGLGKKHGRGKRRGRGKKRSPYPQNIPEDDFINSQMEGFTSDGCSRELRASGCFGNLEERFVATSPSGSYDANNILAYLRLVFPEWGPGRKWSILLLDALSRRPDVVEAAVAKATDLLEVYKEQHAEFQKLEIL